MVCKFKSSLSTDLVLFAATEDEDDHDDDVDNEWQHNTLSITLLCLFRSASSPDSIPTNAETSISITFVIFLFHIPLAFRINPENQLQNFVH